MGLHALPDRKRARAHDLPEPDADRERARRDGGGALGDVPGVVGNFTSGGTESCMLAVKTARDFARATKPHIKEPEAILPVTAHAAFQKGCHYLGVKKVLVPVDPKTFKADPAAIEKAITPNTILIVSSAVSYAHGVLDPIEDIARVAQKHNLLFHVDGCIGGFLLPYFKRLGAKLGEFDFRVPGVTSMSMDFHKYAYCPKGASVVLHRSKDLRRFQMFVTVRLDRLHDHQPDDPIGEVGRADGGGLGGAERARRRRLHALRRTHLQGDASHRRRHPRYAGRAPAGRAGFEPSRLHLRRFLLLPHHRRDGARAAGACSRNSAITARKRTCTSRSGKRRSIRADEFLAALRASVEAAAPKGFSQTAAKVKAELSRMNAADFKPAMMGDLMRAAGIEDGQLPRKSAELNQILNVLPPNVTAFALTEFMNDRYIYRPKR